ncbi:hypothetical protein MMC13_007657 [Lambiella insularis]|nr:hypothetical protein [Lambiella insularis]
MRSCVITGAVWLLASDLAAIVLAKPASNPAVVGFGFQRKRAPEGTLKKRSNINVPMYNTQNAFIYVANVSVGTPPQNVSMQIDTGSSDFWINTPNSVICTSTQQGCPMGTYSANQSSSAQYLSSDFVVDYVIDGMATGDFITDNVVVSGTTIKSMKMGLGYNSSCLANLWGVSYPASEGIVSTNASSQYNNSVLQMVSQGLIQSPTYSLWLNDVAASAGTILFGGIDTSKYQGQLQVLPVVPDPLNGKTDALLVNLTSVTLSDGTQLSTNMTEFPSPVLLDTGTPTITVPNDVFQNLALQLNVTIVQGIALCDCGLANSTQTINFGFNGVNISVPIKSIVEQPTAVDLALFAHTSQSLPSGICVFGVDPVSTGNSPIALLGDSFLRSAYVVYDLANNQISMAPTNFNPGKSNIIEIPSGAGGVAAALKAMNGTTSGNGTMSATPSGTTMPSPTSTSSSASAATTSSDADAMTSGLGQGLVYVGLLAGYGFALLL